MNNFANTLLDRFGEDEPILTDDILDAFQEYSRATVFNRIESALASNELVRYARGVYYIPRTGKYGRTTLNPYKVIVKKYTGSGEDIYGYISGLNLENSAGLSPQVPATLEITTNKESKRIRTVEPFGGWREIKLRAPRVEVNGSNVDALKFLDLITTISPDTLEESEAAGLKKLYGKSNRSTMMECLRSYPARTAKRFIEGEVAGVFA